jgi:hypothetical protein
VGELHPLTHLNQPGVHRGSRRRHLDAQIVRGAAEQAPVTEGLGGRGEDEQLGVGGEQPETLDVAVLDLAGDRPAGGQTESAGQIGRFPGARQLNQRERVAMALRDDLRSAQLMQAAVGQFHLRFDADSSGHVPATDPVRQIAQQGALAHARLAAQDEDATRTRDHVGCELVERGTLVMTSEQLAHYTTP